ncbi:MAG: diacylglycerol kinase family lipid kinase [Bacteroidales bacterium]|nr:diacylglycerol kinase family lipid kinase [Bacteroidales bacterium]
MTKIWKVIVNQKAGRGMGLKDWPYISSAMAKAGLKISSVFTEHKYHAVELTKKAISEGYRDFIAVGGDGTLHEVLNGIFKHGKVSPSDMTLAVISVGSGNDWGRMHNISHEYDEAIQAIAKGNLEIQDVAKVTSFKNGEMFLRYMINIGGMGFDANVCHHFDLLKIKGQSVSRLYIKGLLKAFFGYSTRRFNVVSDNITFYNGDVFSTSIGIGRYSGGGMIQTPEAIVDDGLLELTVIKKIPKYKVLMNLGKLYSGRIFSIKEVIHTRAQKIEIQSWPESRVEVDGEDVGFSPMTVEIIPQSIRVVAAKK